MYINKVESDFCIRKPSISHHLQILKDARIINMHREGTMNFYYVDANESEWGKIADLINHVHAIVQKAAQTGYPQEICEANS